MSKEKKTYKKFSKLVEALSEALGAKANCKRFPSSVNFCDDDVVDLTIECDSFMYKFPSDDSVGVRFTDSVIKDIRKLQKIMIKYQAED